jgi:hypothetical protein
VKLLEVEMATWWYRRLKAGAGGMSGVDEEKAAFPDNLT